jgi:hypothetical protein
MTNHFPGTWRWVKHLDRKGNEDHSHADYSTYTYAADGTGSIDGPGTLSYPLKWKIVGGRLRFVTYFGAGAKMQTTVDFEMPTRNRLIVIDRFRHRDIYERVKNSVA